MDSEEKYPEIRSKLRDLEKVTAGDDFVKKLHMKIVAVNAEKRHEHESRFDEPRGGFLKNLFGNMQYPWLAPAVGFTVLIFFIFYITYLNKTSQKDELLSDQKNESTEQKNIDLNKNPAALKEPYNTSDGDTTLNHKKQPGKDIAGEIKTERNSNEPAPTDNDGRIIDHNKIKDGKDENKSFESSSKILKRNESQPAESESNPSAIISDNDISVKKESEKKKKIPEAVDENGLLSLKKSDQEIKSPGDTESNLRGVVSEDVNQNNKLKEKLNKINRSSLEK
ncbi:MAG: hypothetical protein ABI792_04395, partial [bacterium]